MGQTRFNHRRASVTHTSRLRAIAAGFVFVLALSSVSAAPQPGKSNGFSWVPTTNGWLVTSPNGIPVYFPDKSHKWDGTGKIEQIAAGTIRITVPPGFLVFSASGAEYVPESAHAWRAPIIIEVPAPTPPASPAPSASPEPSAPPPSPSATTAPSPSPTPSPSAEPTSSKLTVPTTVEGLDEIRPGVWRSKDFTNNHVLALHFRFPKPIPFGTTVRKSFKRASNYVVSGLRNDKVDRDWDDKVGGGLNDYSGTQTTGQMIIFSESLNPVSLKRDADGNAVAGWNRAYFNWPGHKAEGQKEVWEKHYPSSPTALDGWYRVTIGGKQVFYADKWQPGPATRDVFCVQEVVSGTAPLAPGVFVEFSEVSVEVLP